MRAHQSSSTSSAPVPLPDADPTDERPNRAARRGNRRGSVPDSHGRGAAPHARGAQGRRINPVRRTG
jgi:hypothetical protein